MLSRTSPWTPAHPVALLMLALLYQLVPNVHAQDLKSAGAKNDIQLFTALCDQSIGTIYLQNNFTLWNENWLKATNASQCTLLRNVTVTGTGYAHSKYGPWIDFQFIARKVVIPPHTFLALHNFTAANTRYGGGGEIDIVAYSPMGVLFTLDLNKNQPSW